MMSKATICIILGSGFSKPAGLPLAKEINSFFTRDNTENLLKFSSGEWKWWDFADSVYRNNGRLNSDWIAYGYILNELVDAFIQQKNEFSNYEEFYQFVIDEIKNREFLKGIYEKAFNKSNFNTKDFKDSPNSEYYIYPFKHPDASEIFNLINYLIDDLLFWRQPFVNFEAQYLPFISFIRNFDQTNIITLNHDILLEALFQDHGITYSDGFTDENSPLETREKKKIKYFKGVFTGNIALIKLHGSIDVYKYIVSNQNGSFVNATGDYIYFKTLDYYEKQMPQRINLETSEVVQDFHSNITPQFITGIRKDEIIKNDKMYSVLYKQFDERIHKCETLLIIGYSYGDVHVNEKILSSLKTGKLKQIININPGMEFPYESRNITIRNLKSIEELV